MKRIFDLVLTAAAAPVLVPVGLVVALVLRLAHGGPVLFRQTRPGFHGEPFEILKFRSMTSARDASGGLLPDAERLTALGRLLRRSSLDELPEFWNVIIGDMSLVGPRPLLMEYLDRYSPEQARRHEVRPGITGWAQVNGRNAITWEQKFALDVWYVDNQTLWLDVRILALTLWAVLKGHGISAPEHATNPPFMGTPPREGGQ